MGSQSSAERRVLVLLCTYNEVDNLPRVVEQLHAAIPSADVLVVDDASPDGTGDWVENQRARDPQLFHLARSGKLGLGSALRLGMQWCLDRDYDYLINLDADLSHQPASAAELLAACDGPQGCEVAVGSRYIPGGGCAGLSPSRKWMSSLLNGYARRLLRLPLTDCSGSFRCYSATALKRLPMEKLSCTGYGFMEEILVQLARQGTRFCEVPIQFEARHSGKSKLSLNDAIGAIAVIHRLAWQQVTGGGETKE